MQEEIRLPKNLMDDFVKLSNAVTVSPNTRDNAGRFHGYGGITNPSGALKYEFGNGPKALHAISAVKVSVNPSSSLVRTFMFSQAERLSRR